MDDRIRVGVIGVGYLGKFHARIYSEMPDVDLVGVVDIDADVANKIAQDYACQAYTDYSDLVDKVDAVSIVVPTVYHLEAARLFLERGIHVLMEKPIAPTLDEAEQLVRLAEKHGALMQVGHLERYNAGVMALLERVKSPRFIEVHRLGVFVERATDVDVVTDLMIHDIDIVMALVNSRISDVAAVGISVLTDHIDIANARLEFDNGAVANVTASRVSNKRMRRIRIFAKSHYYGLDYAAQELEIVKAEQGALDSKRPDITTEKLVLEPKPPLDAELADFIQAVKHGKRPVVDGRVGLEALRVALLVKEKIASCRQQ